MIVFNNLTKSTNCEPGVSRKVLSYNEELMMCEIAFEKDAKGNRHHHKHLQITYVLSGSFDFTIDHETVRVNKGDSILIPSGAEHEVHCIEAGMLLDVFNPMRKEFLE